MLTGLTSSCTNMPAMPIMARRPLLSSFVCIVASASSVLGLRPRGVEAEVSRGVVVPEATLAGDGAGLIEGGGDGLVLYQGHAEEGEHPELLLDGKQG